MCVVVWCVCVRERERERERREEQEQQKQNKKQQLTISSDSFDNILTLHHVNARTVADLFLFNNNAISPKKEPSSSSVNNSSFSL